VSGREFTADDVKYSIERQSTPDPGKSPTCTSSASKLDSIQLSISTQVKIVTNSQTLRAD